MTMLISSKHFILLYSNIVSNHWHQKEDTLTIYYYNPRRFVLFKIL